MCTEGIEREASREAGNVDDDPEVEDETDEMHDQFVGAPSPHKATLRNSSSGSKCDLPHKMLPNVDPQHSNKKHGIRKMVDQDIKDGDMADTIAEEVVEGDHNRLLA
jgi:hypothetical protein